MPNMRIVLIQGMVGGVSLTILIVAMLLQYVEVIRAAAFVAYIISVCGTGVLIFLSIISSFTQKTFIHPDDRLWGNTLSYILFMAAVLSLGHFFDPNVADPTQAAFNQTVRDFSYEAGAYVLITFVLIYIILFVSRKIGFHELIIQDANKREKELVARFILFSILLGVVLVGLKFLLDKLYEIAGYTIGVWIVMGASVAILLTLSIVNWKRYSPVGSSDSISENPV